MFVGVFEKDVTMESTVAVSKTSLPADKIWDIYLIYNLGECEFHLAFETDDYEAAHKLHEEMGCICYENPAMGIYFIVDPDGYWLEIVPSKK